MHPLDAITRTAKRLIIMLEFNEEKHEYRWNGSIIDSTTQILDAMGFISQYCKDEIAAANGTIGHKIMHLLLEDRLDNYDPAFELKMQSIKKFIADENPRFIGLEVMGSSSDKNPSHVGTLDFLGTINSWKERIGILDWKFIKTFSKQTKLSAKLQTAGYVPIAQNVFNLDKKLKLKRAAVHITDKSYHIHNFNDDIDLIYFQSILNSFKLKKMYGFI